MESKMEPWWREYRRRQYRPRNVLSMEMILRKSFRETVKEHSQYCSLAGYQRIFDKKISIRERLFWLVIFICMLCVITYFLRYLWIDTLDKPLVVSMESATYPISDIDFPAIAICNINRVSRKAAIAYAKKNYIALAKNNQSLDEVANFVIQKGRLLDFAYSAIMKQDPLWDAMVNLNRNTTQLVDVMKSLAPDCKEILVKCGWAGKDVDCEKIFAVRRTARGHCCAFNYIMDYNSADRPRRTIASVERQKEQGVIAGLILILDPLLEDYAYPIYPQLRGFEIFIFDPTHFADPTGGRVIHRIAEPNQATFVELFSVKQVAADEIRKYTSATRKCLFHDERQNKFGDMYSYSACIANCRIKTIQTLCKCTPYFLPTESHIPVCTFNDLMCLNKYKEKLLYLFPLDATDTIGLEMEVQDSVTCSDCLPDCELTQHRTKVSKVPLTINEKYFGKQFRTRWTKTTNMTDKSVLAIFQSTESGLLDRVDVVAYWFELLSNIGGMAGILVGFSLVTISEEIYFIFLRLIWRVCNNYKKYYH